MVGQWHSDWQGRFDENNTEVKFVMERKRDTMCRRADIICPDRINIEVQHSYISPYEVTNRCRDYWENFGRDIIWVLDGNQGVSESILSNGSILLIFHKLWILKSFSQYKRILLDMNGRVYKIPLKHVKSNMIQLYESKTIDEIVHCLKTNPRSVWDIYTKYEHVEPIMHISQKGAGNGKTYGILKSIYENSDKKDFIFLTKQHSAVAVFIEELKSQIDRKEYHIESNVENVPDIDNKLQKQYIITYTRKNNGKKCKIIAGTVDSFLFSLTTPEENSMNKFISIAKNLSKNQFTKLSQHNAITYGNQYIILGKNTEIHLDEGQDLEAEYLYGLTALVLETHVDLHIVGDKLQSLGTSENAFTSVHTEGLAGINVVKDIPENINRRIKVKFMSEIINQVVKFSDFDLPPITNGNENLKHKDELPVEVIGINKTWQNKNQKMDENCELILNLVNKEIEKNNYLPEDFLFVFPIMKDNIFAEELETKLNQFWIYKFNDNDFTKNVKTPYWREIIDKCYLDDHLNFAYLHAHTEGQVIDKSKSEHASRIMSIRSSKGDGRSVVFILKCTRDAIEIVSRLDPLSYESHLHVAMTRATDKIYFMKEDTDDISERFPDSITTGTISLPRLNHRLNVSSIDYQSSNLQNYLLDNEVAPIVNEENNKNKGIVDWGYHCIRYSLFQYLFIFSIFDQNPDIDWKEEPIFENLLRIRKLKIKIYNPTEFYDFIKYKDCLDIIPICVYDKMSNDIKNKLIQAANRILEQLKTTKIDPNTDAYDMVMFTYIYEICTRTKYCSIKPNDLYNITRFFDASTKESNFFDVSRNTFNLVKQFHKKIKEYGPIKWKTGKFLKYNGNNKDFVFFDRFNFLAYNDEYVFNIDMVANISSLNEWDLLTKLFMQNVIINNPGNYDDEKDGDNIKFGNKKIKNFIFDMENQEFKTVEQLTFDYDIHTFKNVFKKEFEKKHISLFFYLKHLKETNANSPYSYIANSDIPKYVKSFFETAEDKIDENPNDEAQYLDEERFMKKIDIKLNKELNRFFDIQN